MVCIGLSVLLSTNLTTAQIFQDSTSLNLAKRDVDCIYNMQFNDADQLYAKIVKLYPGHPVVFLLRGLSTYWKNYPMLYSNPARISYEEDLRRCIRLSEKNSNAAYESEYLLANLCARGMLLKLYDDNNLTLNVISLATGTYKYLRRSFRFAHACTDLQYYTGVYNYYREVYPTVYPVYKPLALLFPAGNKEAGLKDLQSAAADAVVLRGESYMLLSWVYLNFENKYQQALHYCKTLHGIYPENVLVSALYIKNLLLMKRYDEAEKLILDSLKETGNNYFRAQLIIFKGLLQEKKYHNYNLAQQYYNSGISKMAPFGQYGKEYTAYAYFGLSRISDTNREKEKSKMFREKAMKLGDFKKINFDK